MENVCFGDDNDCWKLKREKINENCDFNGKIYSVSGKSKRFDLDCTYKNCRGGLSTTFVDLRLYLLFNFVEFPHVIDGNFTN